MANTKSAEKRNRQAEKRRASNKAANSTRLKSSLKTARAGVAGTKGDAAKDIITSGYSDIAKAAKKG